MATVFGKAKKKEIVRIRPDGVDEQELFENISKVSELTAELSKKKKESDAIKAELKQISLSEYLEEYKLNSENPVSIIIEAYNEDGDKGEFMYSIGDKYINIKDEKSADELIEKYGEDVIKKERIYSFNPEMLEKYAEVISKFIMKTTEIEETDKGNLFFAEEKYRIENGTINNLMSISENTFEDIEKVFEDIKPVETLKSSKIIKS